MLTQPKKPTNLQFVGSSRCFSKKSHRSLACVDWAGCCADFEAEEEEAGIRRAAAESDAEDSAMDAYYRGKYGD